MGAENTSVNIPSDDLPVLKGISGLDKSRFDSLITALREAKPTLTRRQFTNRISERVKTIPSPEVASILRVVFILYLMKDRAGASSQELAETVSESAVQSSSKEIQFSQEEKELLGNRLKLLLSFDKSLAVTAKAMDVMTEHEHVFCEARILSDIRPVFTDPVESASGGVIIHNLQIGFHDSGTGQHKEFYVALDADDVEVLKKVLERAEKKTTALQSILDASKIPYLET